MKEINQLVTYGIEHNLIKERDAIYSVNKIMYLLDINVGFEFELIKTDKDVDSLLEEVADLKGEFSTATEKELFKSKLIDTMLDKPSLVEDKFYNKYNESPKVATDYFYQLSRDVNYIKDKQIAKNIMYKYDSKYGQLDITINMSKPEKSPEEIKRLKEIKSADWPKCFLCVEQEGYYGNLKNPDRSNHRIINVELDGQDWFFQYSPYSYFPEHSIVLKKEHYPMKINKQTFINLTSFVSKFPHYMIGSNADLPIVGGSMLTHDHYQAGNYNFPIFDAKEEFKTMQGDVEVSIIKWPLSTIKLSCSDKDKIVDKADELLTKWRNYSNEKLGIINKTDQEHNTITPIVKKNGENFEAYLLLRNNITSDEHPDGVFHPHKEKHFIKRENIGLIEASGLAVLPARLNANLNKLEEAIVNNEQLPEELEDFKNIYKAVVDSGEKDINKAIKQQIGEIFDAILEDCNVFNNDIDAMIKFIEG